ncbi:MAG: PIN domain-containing protein [Candidatus Jacksonbacteria bacterium]
MNIIKQCFFDTSAIVSTLIKNDQHHQKATQILSNINKKPAIERITTDYVLDESLTLLKARGYYKLAADFSKGLLGTNFKIIYITPAIFQQSLLYFAKHQDKAYSFTDCVSFVVMRNYQIKHAFTFDHHFEQASFLIIK